MNYSGQFKQASEIIYDVIFLDSEGIFLIDLTARDYITLKASPLVRKIIKPNGNYYELLGKLLDPDNQNISPRFHPFLDLNVKKGTCFSRDIYILQDDRKVYMRMYLFPATDKKSVVITLSSPVNTTYEDYLAKFKNKVLSEFFLYSMIVDLDKNACLDCYVSEITMSGQDNMNNPAFIEGCLVAAWPQVFSKIMANKDLPFE